jgi:thiamine biosynthesis protein ThiS
MITIRLNERCCVLEKQQNVTDLLGGEGFSAVYCAVALNKQFIPRAEYDITFIKEGDCVDVVSPMEGG